MRIKQPVLRLKGLVVFLISNRSQRGRNARCEIISQTNRSIPLSMFVCLIGQLSRWETKQLNLERCCVWFSKTRSASRSASSSSLGLLIGQTTWVTHALTHEKAQQRICFRRRRKKRKLREKRELKRQRKCDLRIPANRPWLFASFKMF